jgi:site-specific recombinase XerD
MATAYVNRWVDSLRDGIAPATVSGYWRNLRPFFSWWAKENDQPNPFRGADVPSAPLEPPDVLHLDDIRALFEVCRGRDFASLRDTALSGCCSTPGVAAATSSTSRSLTGIAGRTS